MLQETLKECQLGKKRLRGSQGQQHILGCATCPLHSCSCVVLLPHLMTVCPGMERGETGGVRWSELQGWSAVTMFPIKYAGFKCNPLPINQKNYSNGNEVIALDE